MAVAFGNVGAVVIGRNEGARLATCLNSVCMQLKSVVYVDSGSTDGSIELAASLGATVVALSPERPFTAARARNAGAERLREIGGLLEYVQFVDGDCELRSEWLPAAVPFLSGNGDVAVVCGRRRERYPEASPYNRLCDMEWETPVGECAACGGDSLMRLNAFEEVGGFSPELIAGEEPDLCFRLRQAGWRVFRLDAEMTLHDAAMTRAKQWWQRSVRSGYAAAEAHRRRGKFEPRLQRQVLSNAIWSLPIAWPLWPFLWLRVSRRRGALYASHIVLGKIPHLIGQLRFWRQQWQGRPGALIEYK
jgi:GT2 family glycosyltransferase